MLVISHDIVGPAVAGPGMRSWAISEALSQHCNVVLLVPQGSMPPESLAVVTEVYTPGRLDSVSEWLSWADVVVAGSEVPLLFPQITEWPCPLVVDGYDPHLAETLALWHDTQPIDVQCRKHAERMSLLISQCYAADYVICASEIQRTWWLGLLAAFGRINPHTYADDPSLRKLVGVVPFALPATQFPATPRSSLLPNVGPEDVVLLWGGGLWEWMDPLTVIAALPRVLRSTPQVKLLFPGTRHPNPGMPAMSMVQSALHLSRELGLLDKAVYFGDWVPREAWYDYLGRADIGLSAHLDTLESRLAFRSRVLDYIWAGLPMVVSSGDATSDLVRSYGVGLTVAPGDVDGMATAILDLASRPREDFHTQFDRARTELTWDAAVQPLVEFCLAPRRSPDRDAGFAWLDRPPVRQSDADEAQRLRATVAAYERGRVVRLSRWLRKHLGWK